MSAAKRDPRRAELDKYLDAYRKLSLPEGNAFEQAVWCVLARNGTREGASKALASLWTRYVDVNELRVAQLDEVAALIAPHVKNEADRVAAMTRAFLRAIVRGQHQMSFDFVEEMTLDELRKFLAELGSRASDVAFAMLIHFCRTAIEADQPQTELPEEESGAKPRRKGERDLGAVVDRLRLLFTVAGYGHPEGKGQPATLVRRVLKLLDYTTLPPRPAPEPRPAPVVPKLDDDEEEPDDEDLEDVGTDDDLDDLDDVDSGYDEDDEGFEEFEDEDEGPGTGKGGKKRGTTRRKKTTGTTSAKQARSTARKKSTAARKPTAKKTTAKKGTPRKAAGKSTGKGAAKSTTKPARKAASKGAAKSGSASRGGGAARPRTSRKTARKSPTARKSSRRR